MSKPDFKQRDENRGKSIKSYWPLICLILVTAAMTAVLSWLLSTTMIGTMHFFMGIFLCIFALLKLFHPSAFADGFQMYDLLAKFVRPYAYAYPLIELGLGLAYLSFEYSQYVYIATIAVMLFSALGVIYALNKGLDIKCPCMGSILNVPLSTVTLVENLSMAAMAGYLLYTLY